MFSKVRGASAALSHQYAPASSRTCSACSSSNVWDFALRERFYAGSGVWQMRMYNGVIPLAGVAYDFVIRRLGPGLAQQHKSIWSLHRPH